MERIGIEPSGNIIPRESGQTSIWSLITKKLEKPTQETKQMTVVRLLVRSPAMNSRRVGSKGVS